jgi:hypothetical protein
LLKTLANTVQRKSDGLREGTGHGGQQSSASRHGKGEGHVFFHGFISGFLYRFILSARNQNLRS